ncbi:MAG: DUF2933 domain-containing protein [Desulfurivibrionaceae bacterium]
MNDKPARPKLVKYISGPRAAFLALLLVGGYLLWVEHRAHLLEIVPFLFLLACPLMHVFMHHGHGGHERPSGERPDRREPGDKGESDG